MFKFLNRKMREKGQSTLEYAILIIIIIAALLSIQVYIKRGVQNRLKSATDDISDGQFSPGNTNIFKQTNSHSRTEVTTVIGHMKEKMIDDETTNVFSSQNIVNNEQEFWGN